MTNPESIKVDTVSDGTNNELDLVAIHKAAEDYEWVDCNERLAELCIEWRKQPLLGLDTEFLRTDTFYPKPGLIQVACLSKCYLLDPLKITDFDEFIKVLTDPSVLKLLHACSEDLELFVECFGVAPQPIFDSQVAGAFLGLGLSIGYQRLLDNLFQVEVGKEETRSDWLQRPLTDGQKLYAAIDVTYLGPIYQLLSDKLRQQGKFPWVMEECQRLVDAAVQPADHDRSYLQRFKQAWKLQPRQLAVLKELSSWREEEARKRDMPRNFLLHNNSIMEMAMRPPSNMRALAAVDKMRGRTVSSDGKLLLKLVQEALDAPLDIRLESPPRPLPSSWAKRLKPLKETIRQIAERLELAPEMLVRRKDLEELVRSGLNGQAFALPVELKGWREEVVGRQLLEELRSVDNGE